MARDVQQENIYERKTKVIKKERRCMIYYISFSLMIFYIHCGIADTFLISILKSLDGILNENIIHTYTSITLNITVFDLSLFIIFIAAK